MQSVQVSPKATSDIATLSLGVDRTDVALQALKDSQLTPKQGEQLSELLKSVSPTAGTHSAAGGRFERIDGHEAVVGQILVKGRHVETLLCDGALGLRRADQIAYAEKLGYRLATREENVAYAHRLLGKEVAGSINEAESYALATYRRGNVRDTTQSITVSGWGFDDHHYHWYPYDYPYDGALFVRDSPESKRLSESLAEDTHSVAQSQAGGRFKPIAGHRGVVGQITVRGQQVDTLLVEGTSSNEERFARARIIKKLGYETANREESLAYANSLLGKEVEGTINKAESHALRIYRDERVRDRKSILQVFGKTFEECTYITDPHFKLSDGWLYVRRSAESK
jgi:hypothetical protein